MSAAEERLARQSARNGWLLSAPALVLLMVGAIVITIVATAKPGHTLAEIEAVIQEEIDRLKTAPPDAGAHVVVANTIARLAPDRRAPQGRCCRGAADADL